MNTNWDACATISALITSVVAIVISISTAKRQNKIALYERRYSLFKRCNEFYSIACAYWRKGDMYSIDIIQLANLDKQIDNDAQEAVFLFNEKISCIILEGKKHFEDIVRFYNQNNGDEIDEARCGELVNKIRRNQREFLENTSSYLEL